MEETKLSTYPQAQGGGGRLNRKNIVVSRPENALNKGKSSNFNTAKITPKIQQNYGKNASKNEFIINKKSCLQINSENNLTKQNITSNKIKFFGLEQKFQTNKSSLKNNFINISLFSLKCKTKHTKNKSINAQKSLVVNETSFSKSFINITLFGKQENQSNLEHKYKNYSFNQYELNQNNNETSQRKIHKTKLLALIFSLFFIFSTLLTSGVFLIVNYVNKSNAIKSSNYISIGDILKDENTVNYGIYSSLKSKLGTKTGTVDTLDGGTPIVFTMAGRDWQVVFRDPDNSDIITVWMTDYYTNSRFNSSTSSGNNYNGSQIQTIVKNYFNTQANTYPVLNNITVSPNAMSDSYKTAQDQNGSYGGYTSVNGAISSLTDKFWLPSLYETFSFWGLDDTDRSMSPYYCWLRSGYSGNNNRNAMLVYYSGSADNLNVDCGYSVRPAAHISLEQLAKNAGYKILGNTTNASVDKSSSFYVYNSGIDHTFTYTPNSNYYINSITIGGTDGSPAQTNVTINASAPPSYSTLGSGSCVYKVYRDGNTVKVVINQATEYITIVGSATATTITFSSGSNLSNVSWSRADYNIATATISATVSSGYYPQFSYNSSDNIKMPAAAGSGGIGSVRYSYTFSSNVLNLTLTNLPTGYNAIPTLSLTAYTLDSNNLIVNVSNAIYEIIYESTQIVVNVTPNSSYYITQAHTNSNTPEDIKYIMGTLAQTGNAHAIIYYANQNTSKVTFVLRDLSGDLTLNIVTGNNKPDLATSGGTQIDGVACYAENGGEARMVGYANDDTAVTFIAVPYANYQFDGWFIQGETTALNTNLSCTLDMSIIKGKIIVAHFSKTTNKTNTDTNTPDTGGFV